MRLGYVREIFEILAHHSGIHRTFNWRFFDFFFCKLFVEILCQCGVRLSLQFSTFMFKTLAIVLLTTTGIIGGVICRFKTESQSIFRNHRCDFTRSLPSSVLPSREFGFLRKS